MCLQRWVCKSAEDEVRLRLFGSLKLLVLCPVHFGQLGSGHSALNMAVVTVARH